MRIIKDKDYVETQIKCPFCTRTLGFTVDDITLSDVGPDTITCVCGKTLHISFSSLPLQMRKELQKLFVRTLRKKL